MDVDAVNKQHHITCRPFFFYTTLKKSIKILILLLCHSFSVLSCEGAIVSGCLRVICGNNEPCDEAHLKC